MKRHKDKFRDVLDFCVSLVLLGISSPLFILTLIFVKLDSPGPAFYTQERYGKNKKIFKIYKFRSMRVGAENGCPVWGTECDPRSTRLGRLLRVLHLDELPQLFNVLRGEMRLVGPRPERPYFADTFKHMIPDYDRRHEVKPGITGWSQINGLRGESSIEERTEMDIFYIRNSSLFFDLLIIILTPFAKPIRKAQEEPELNIDYYERAFSQREEVEENIPLMVPIMNE